MTAHRLPLYACFFISGASALIYEIVWHRMLTLVFGLSTLSVAAVLSAFLAGLAAGAKLFARPADRTSNPVRLYAAIECVIAATALASGFYLPYLLRGYAAIYAALPSGQLTSNLVRFALAFIAVGLPSILIGGTVPAMARLAAGWARSTGIGFARFYAVNTLGSVAGAALAGFVLIRALGVQMSLLVAVAGNAVCALTAWALSLRRLSPPALAPQPSVRAEAILPIGPKGRTMSAQGNALGSGSAEAIQALKGRAKETTAISQVTDSLPPIPSPHSPVPVARFALIAATVSGAAALAYETAWMRLLAVYTLNSVYVFTMVVTVFLAALAGGAAITGRLLRSRGPRPLLFRRTPHASGGDSGRDPLRILVVTQALLALCGPVLLAVVPRAAGLNLPEEPRPETQIILLEYGLTLAVVFLPTVLLGMTLPLLVSMLDARAESAGSAVARIYVWNSFGTIAGAALTGAVLIPLIGLRGTLLALGAVAIGLAGAAEGFAGEGTASLRWRSFVPGTAALFALTVALTPSAERFYRPVGPDETVIYYAEGPSATVHVSEFSEADRRHRTLFVDSQSVAGTYDEIVTDQKMLAHLPLLLHADPHRALTVGFGTGGTSYSMLLHPGVAVDCAEIEPRVPDAYRFFESENLGQVGPDHERHNFHLALDDARAWLHVAPHHYDVIVTDVTSIQYRGNGNLYTTDYFRLMRDRLTEKGIGCAWAPLTGVTADQLKVLLRSFREVYPHTSVWYMINLPTDFLILVGTPGRLALDLADWAERTAPPGIHKDLARVGLDDPHKLAACLLLAEEDCAAYVGEGPLHTDDRPILDYMTHASRSRNTLSANLSEMLAHRSDAADYVARWPAPEEGGTPPEEWLRWREAAGHLIEGHVHLRGTAPDRLEHARRAYEKAAALVPEDETTQSLAADLRGQEP